MKTKITFTITVLKANYQHIQIFIPANLTKLIEFFIIRINYLICKIILIIKQIQIKLTNFLLSPQCYFDYINSMRQLNVISLNINQIYYGVNNSQRQLISLFNCIFIWLSIIIILSIFKYYNYCIYQFYLDHYILTLLNHESFYFLIY